MILNNLCITPLANGKIDVKFVCCDCGKTMDELSHPSGLYTEVPWGTQYCCEDCYQDLKKRETDEQAKHKSWFSAFSEMKAQKEKHMITINNKFQIGETCFTNYHKPVHYKCPVCDGNGKFQYNGYEIRCSNCSGSGKLHNSHQTIETPCEVKIKSVRTSLDAEGNISISYAVSPKDPNIPIKKRREDWLFKTEEECAEQCEILNQKKNII